VSKQTVRASFSVEKNVLDEFRRLVVHKYGRLWGVLCKEFAEALKERSDRIREELDTGLDIA